MGIRPVDFGGIIQRADDIAHVKKHEDIKPFIDQQNIQMQVNKRDNEMKHRVIKSDSSNEANNNQNAKDEGKGQYYSTNHRHKKKNNQKDKIVNKRNNTSFDIKI